MTNLDTVPLRRNCLTVFCSDIEFLKNLRSSTGLEFRPQSAFTVFRDLCPLQTILMSDLEGCYIYSPLQIEMSDLRNFFKFIALKTAISVYLHARPASSNFKKVC